jgi:hypothetical protein
VRLTERPFVVLRHLAYDIGRRNQWGDAECVLQVLVVRCPQFLPLYHLITLPSLLGLAIDASMVRKTAFAEREYCERMNDCLLTCPRWNTIICSAFQWVGLLASSVLLYFVLNTAEMVFVCFTPLSLFFKAI